MGKPVTRKVAMQKVFEEVAKRIVSDNPDSDKMLSMLSELRIVEMELSVEDQKEALTNVAAAYGLEVPECLK